MLVQDPKRESERSGERNCRRPGRQPFALDRQSRRDQRKAVYGTA